MRSPHPPRTSSDRLICERACVSSSPRAARLLARSLPCRPAVRSAASAAGQEPLNVVRYRAGGMYASHCDGPCDGTPAQPGGRVASAIVYCALPSDGSGATAFPSAAVHVSPERGQALLIGWGSTDALQTNRRAPRRRGARVDVGRRLGGPDPPVRRHASVALSFFSPHCSPFSTLRLAALLTRAGTERKRRKRPPPTAATTTAARRRGRSRSVWRE